MKPLAIFGGTFDPVHLGHLRAAWEASELLDAEVCMMPARVPPHRPPTVADATARVALLRAALSGQDRLLLDERELGRDGPSYSIDTLAELRAEIGPQRPLILLLGADAFAGLASWHQWRRLFELAHIAVLTRPGGGSGALPGELAREVEPRRVAHGRQLAECAYGRVCGLSVTPIDISASEVRALLAAGRSPRYLVPDAVLEQPPLLAPYRVD
ncbi:nicotinate-nucleotide adenylyltransferase [Oleiagrimonas sp. C23AA]|uniref:nicotinate-nucleotide adenylyltransferase n=1 Tax=Oleiagrimonas sp. C23AA TaxID=2719047 RepID=UPI00141E523F|nr:nicotinate-nucleotide adenylyltransferase [Oleiagrimonas sp. C23AA]NII10087.1 nicotinate-nucleotide adenylyltransferase [Oleiagrimonas sp. C23AA]